MKIEICNNCDGHGFIWRDIGTHQSEYEKEFCENCNGTGKIIVAQVSTFISLPYSEDNEKIISATANKIYGLSQEILKENNIKK